MIVKATKTRIFKPGGKAAKKSEYESATSIGKWLECPVLYHEHYTKKFREPISKELLFGRAWHGLCEDALVEKLWHERNMAVSELDEIWGFRWLFEMFMARDEFTWKGEQSPQDFFQSGKKLYQQWQAEYLPKLFPSSKIEKQFWIPITDSPLAVMGFLDLVTVDGLLIDHKTGSRTWKQMGKDENADDLQMMIYHGAYQEITDGLWPIACQLHRAVIGVGMETIDMTYKPERVQDYFDKTIKPTLASISRAWKSGDFPCTCKRHKGVTGAPPERPLYNSDLHINAGTTAGEVQQASSNLLNPPKAEVKPPAKQEPVQANEEIPF